MQQKALTKKLKRCDWAGESSLPYIEYHDTEWGVPVWDDRRQFEFLILEGAQAGLSWSTILNKRDGYRKAFAEFDPGKVARFTQKRIDRILANPNVVRNKLKVNAAVGNAKAFLDVQEEFDGFCNYIWRFVDGRPKQNRLKKQSEIPATSPESDAMSKDMRERGFRFVGSTILYAHMQATGMVNDHLLSCFRHKECAALGGKARSLNRVNSRS
ncbi:MAG TPA: DNA-3-methyladenine glycosylase I [Woeseiaceae bacterium]|nr:DNA-3-methyladenine glycosylase I [Woeseiaceae bacterium]